MRSRWFVLAILGWILAGCQHSAVQPQPQTGFFTLGKLALRSPSESLTVRFRWQQSAERYDLELWGPFGQGRTRLVGDSKRMSVLDAAGETVLAGRPAEVIRAQIGWDLPLLSLVDWAQGRPGAKLPTSAVTQDGEGRYLAFTQQNWQVRYLSYYPLNARPKSMALQTGDYRIKVAFGRWQEPQG